MIRLGTGEKEVFYSSSIHANEWINSVLMMKFIENYAKAYEKDEKIGNINARELFEKTSIYIAPMTNPDGVDLVLWQLPQNSRAFVNAKGIASGFPDIPFPNGWKANILGVDLNLQFPAEWEKAREIKFQQGFIRPAPRDFVGYRPLSEPEARALYELTLNHDFDLILAYHTQGKVIYWRFLNFKPEGAEALGKEFSRVSGYTLDDQLDNESYAGFRDFFIKEFDLPGYTIETGEGQNPLPITQFEQIYRDNVGILVLAANS